MPSFSSSFPGRATLLRAGSPASSQKKTNPSSSVKASSLLPKSQNIDAMEFYIGEPRTPLSENDKQQLAQWLDAGGGKHQLWGDAVDDPLSGIKTAAFIPASVQHQDKLVVLVAQIDTQKNLLAIEVRQPEHTPYTIKFEPRPLLTSMPGDIIDNIVQHLPSSRESKLSSLSMTSKHLHNKAHHSTNIKYQTMLLIEEIEALHENTDVNSTNELLNSEPYSGFAEIISKLKSPQTKLPLTARTEILTRLAEKMTFSRFNSPALRSLTTFMLSELEDICNIRYEYREHPVLTKHLSLSSHNNPQYGSERISVVPEEDKKKLFINLSFCVYLLAMYPPEEFDSDNITEEIENNLLIDGSTLPGSSLSSVQASPDLPATDVENNEEEIPELALPTIEIENEQNAEAMPQTIADQPGSASSGFSADGQVRNLFSRLCNIFNHFKSPEIINQLFTINEIGNNTYTSTFATMNRLYEVYPSQIGIAQFSRLLQYVENNQQKLSDDAKYEAISHMSEAIMQHTSRDKSQSNHKIAEQFDKLCNIIESLSNEEHISNSLYDLISFGKDIPDEIRNICSDRIIKTITSQTSHYVIESMTMKMFDDNDNDDKNYSLYKLVNWYKDHPDNSGSLQQEKLLNYFYSNQHVLSAEAKSAVLDTFTCHSHLRFNSTRDKTAAFLHKLYDMVSTFSDNSVYKRNHSYILLFNTFQTHSTVRKQFFDKALYLLSNIESLGTERDAQMFTWLTEFSHIDRPDDMDKLYDMLAGLSNDNPVKAKNAHRLFFKTRFTDSAVKEHCFDKAFSLLENTENLELANYVQMFSWLTEFSKTDHKDTLNQRFQRLYMHIDRTGRSHSKRELTPHLMVMLLEGVKNSYSRQDIDQFKQPLNELLQFLAQNVDNLPYVQEYNRAFGF